MAKYRKKPVVIEAAQWNGMNTQEIKDFVGDALGPLERRPDYDLTIRTLEGDHKALRNDYTKEVCKYFKSVCNPR